MSGLPLDAAPAAEFAAVCAPLFEHAAWISEGMAERRPFGSLTALHAAMMARLLAAPVADQVAFLCGHPMLSRAPGAMTAESVAEQRAAGIAAFSAAEAAELDAGNAEFLARFGFPFILAVRHASARTILAALRRRLLAGREAELVEALREVGAISWMRLLDAAEPAGTGGISLHVLDTVRTRPAAGLAGGLWRDGACAAPFTTDAQGRAVLAVPVRAGAYEWRLDTASYWAGLGVATADRGFLPEVVVRFTVVNPEEHFHVPVLLSQGSYTTYRGS